jgi:NAD(P)-dependent dehydrogenase (short-subunit alcohol dehydrogenase family)
VTRRSCKSLVDEVIAEFGQLHLLASNAGIEHFGPLQSIRLEDFDRVFHTNVAGQLFVTQSAAAVNASGGRIVLTSSVSARIAVHHHTLYCASKAAVNAMVLTLAPELAEIGIAINAIAPGGPPRPTWLPRTPSTTSTRPWPRWTQWWWARA